VLAKLFETGVSLDRTHAADWRQHDFLNMKELERLDRKVPDAVGQF